MNRFPLRLTDCSAYLLYSTAVLGLLFMSVVAAAQDEASSRLTYILKQADQITITMTPPGEAPLKLERQTQPVLKFTNPLNQGQADGALLLWLDGDMPIVAASFYIRKNNELYRELASLAESPLIGKRDELVIWQPATGCFTRRTLPDSRPPSPNDRLRLTQMKRAAERFSAKDMRLMPTPLYRYSSKKYGVIDGAMFALVRATDPDVLLLIEAVQQDADTQAWRYSIGRMHSFPLKVLLDGDEVCSFEPYWAKPDPTLTNLEQWDSKLPLT
jgi:hypothetical protein